MCRKTISGATTQPKWFSTTWNKKGLTYGTCVVSIPENHEVGAIEKPTIWKLEINEDPEKHVVVNKPILKPHDPFFAELGDAVQGALEKDITIFIHGFNNTF